MREFCSSLIYIYIYIPGVPGPGTHWYPALLHGGCPTLVAQKDKKSQFPDFQNPKMHTRACTSPLSPETPPIVRKPGFQSTTSPESEKKQFGTPKTHFLSILFLRACPRGPPLVRNQSDSPEPVRRISPAPVRNCLLTCLLLEKHFEAILGLWHHQSG